MEILELKVQVLQKLLSNLVQADIIEPVSGYEKENINLKLSVIAMMSSFCKGIDS